MHVGIICEGSTDDVVLRALIHELADAVELTFSLLQPNKNNLVARSGPGWQGVRKFLQMSKEGLDLSTLDLIVVHVDADIRKLPEVDKHLISEAGDHALDPLCRHVKSWMGADIPPKSVVIVLPRERTEAWLLAANSRKRDVESIADPDKELPDSGSRGKRDKSVPAYQELAKPLLPKLAKPKELATIPELERFVGKVRARLRRVAAEAKAAKARRP